MNIGNGDEVIVPSNTYIATALAVSYCGAKPIFVEPELETYNINPALNRRKNNRSNKSNYSCSLTRKTCRYGYS